MSMTKQLLALIPFKVLAIYDMWLEGVGFIIRGPGDVSHVYMCSSIIDPGPPPPTPPSTDTVPVLGNLKSELGHIRRQKNAMGCVRH